MEFDLKPALSHKQLFIFKHTAEMRIDGFRRAGELELVKKL